MKINLDFKLKSFTFLLTLFISLHFAKIGVDLHHHGIMVNGAMGLLSQNGKIYREYYYHYGPITAFLHAIVFYIFGVKLVYIQVFTSIVYAITSVLLFKLARLLLNSRNSLLSVLIWIFFAPFYIIEMLPWSSVYILPLFILIFIIVLKNKKNKYDFFYIGIFFGLIFLFRQSSGIIAFLGLISLIPFYTFKKVFISICAFILIVFSAFLILYKTGIFYEYYQSCFVGQKKMVLIENSSLVSSIKKIIIDVLSVSITDVWLTYSKSHFVPYFKYVYNIFLYVFIIFMIFKIIKKYRKKNLKSNYKLQVSILILSLISLSQMYPITCLRHYYWAFTPVIPIIYFSIIQLLKYLYNYSNYLSRFFKYFLIFIILISISIRIEIGLRRTLELKQDFVKLDKKKFPLLSGLYVPKSMSNFYDELYQNKDSIDKIVFYNDYNFEPYLIPFVISKPPTVKITYDQFKLLKVDSLSKKFISSTIYFPPDQILYYTKFR